MLILAVDTSAVAASASVLKDGKIIGEAYVNNGLTHSQTVMPLIDSVLSFADVKMKDIDFAAVAYGPGSFTGVRIGIAAVKGLCFTNETPCFGISSLEALAECAAAEGSIVCPVMDARCKQVYTALFEIKNSVPQRLLPDSAIPLDELEKLLAEKQSNIILIGDGADIAYSYFGGRVSNLSCFPEIFKYQHSSGVACAAMRMYNKGEKPIQAASLMPFYLRPPQAERELNKKRTGEK